MDDNIRRDILALAKQAHDLTESSYRDLAATRDAPGWSEKQRLLLADMALHLLQTALRDGALAQNDLTRNLYSILSISDQFVPGHGLKQFADQLYAGVPAPEGKSGRAS